MIIAAAGIIGVLALLTIQSMLKYVTTSNTLADMNAQIVKEAGGVAINQAQSIHGGRWWFQNLCIDNPCPTIKQDFLVPLEPGTERNFMEQNLLAAEGFKLLPSTSCQLDKPGTLCLASGSKGKVSISIVLDPVVKQSDLVPSRDVSPKVWRTLSAEGYPQEYYGQIKGIILEYATENKKDFHKV